MSQNTLNIFGHPNPVCITGNHQMAMRFFIQEIQQRMQTCDGYILIAAYQSKIAKSIQTLVEQTCNPSCHHRLAVFTFTELEHWIIASPELSRNICAACHSCIFWIESTQFEDLSLEYLFEISKRLCLPAQTHPIFFIPASYQASFISRCPYPIEPIHFADEVPCHTPAVYYFSDHADPSKILPPDFWKRCKSTQTLVACRTETHRLRYAEASHRAHIPVQSEAEYRSNKTSPKSGFQIQINNIESCRPPLDGNCRHIVTIDPLPDTDITAYAKASLPMAPITQKAHLSYLVTNRFSLLNILANHQNQPQHTPAIPISFVQIYHLYALLYQQLNIPLTASLTDAQNQAIQHWIQIGLVNCNHHTCTITAKGRQQFPGIKRFTELGALHGWHQWTDCESPNHQHLGQISTRFLRHSISQRFSFCLQPTQRLFHNLLGNTAILRVNTETANTVWLDAMPICCTYEQTRRIQKILYAEGYTHNDIDLDDACRQKLVQTQASFADVPAPCFIETTNDIAHWWTFAGAQNNAILTQFLTILAPKLQISYGNCHLRLAWHRNSASTGQQIIQRLSDLTRTIQNLAKCLQNNAPASSEHQKTFQALQQQWKKTHLYSWLFDILPPSIVQQQYTDEMNFWAKSIPNTPVPVVEVSTLRHIDPALRLHFAPLQPPSPPQKLNPTSDSKSPQALLALGHASPRSQFSQTKPEITTFTPSAIQFEQACRIHSANTPSRPKHGIMHTRMPWYYIDNNTNLNHALNIMLKQPFIGLDVETTLHDQRLCLIQIGCAEQSFIIDPLSVNISPLAHLFTHPGVIKVIHNASFEKRVLGKLGMQIAPVIDTVCVSRKRHGQKAPGGHSLKSVCMREFNLDMDKECQRSRWDRRPLTPTQLEYAALDAEILIYLYRLYFEK